MERYTMIMDWKNQYRQNDWTTLGNLQIQCNPYQITNGIFHRTRTKISKFICRHKRPRIAKAFLRKKNGTGGINLLTTDYTTKLQSSRQHGTGTKTEYRPMEQDRKPRDKSMHLWAPYLWQRRQEYTMEKRQNSLTNGVGKTGQPLVKE